MKSRKNYDDELAHDDAFNLSKDKVNYISCYYCGRNRGVMLRQLNNKYICEPCYQKGLRD
jgi:hypothetical protein